MKTQCMRRTRNRAPPRLQLTTNLFKHPRRNLCRSMPRQPPRIVTRAHNAVHDWDSLSKDDRKALDLFDEHMRNFEAQRAIQARVA